jgi:hypothetical protein
LGDQRRLRGVEQRFENDEALANVVWAVNREKCHVQLAVDHETIRRLAESKLFGPIGDYCGLIHGKVPNDGTQGLLAAHALFQGLQRPCVVKGRDDEICIYILNPDRSFIYGAGELRRGVGPRRLPKPDDSVFVVYADLKPMTYRTVSGKEIATGGQILFWEWVLAEIESPTFPAGYGRRYKTRIW